MSDTIFANSNIATETWSAQGAIMLWSVGSGGGASIPMALQNVTLNYARRIQPFFPINTVGNGKAKKININGAPSGVFSCASLLTPDAGDLNKFLKACGKPNKTAAEQVTISLRPFGEFSGTTASMGLQYVMHDVELTSLGIQIQGGEMALVTQPLSFVFSTLTL